MNTEYVWWFVAVLLAGAGMVAFLAFGHVPEIEDEAAGRPAGAEPHSAPESTTIPGPGEPSPTSDPP
ncbi:MAG TPA: hypothetical protein VLM76_14100 [Patescibacteria group bacterium]|nr:hypothetical protein [Patescibacteria group bacterium]